MIYIANVYMDDDTNHTITVTRVMERALALYNNDEEMAMNHVESRISERYDGAIVEVEAHTDDRRLKVCA